MKRKIFRDNNDHFRIHYTPFLTSEKNILPEITVDSLQFRERKPLMEKIEYS